MSHLEKPALVAVLLASVALAGCARGAAAPPAASAASEAAASRGASADFPVDGCWGPAVVTSGERRLALIVAVGRFANPRIPQLEGPPHDAKRIYDLLTDERGYAFPRQNVCVLVNEQATLEVFEKAFRTALIARAEKGKNDPVVVYYSGHGSTTPDLSGDEVNGFDQTWVLYDSRSAPDKHDLLDDRVFELTVELAKKTRAISYLLDSCTSGTGIRAGALVPRAVAPERLAEQERRPAAPPAAGTGASARDLPVQIPGLVLLAAARDGTFAYETEGRGIFTDALLRALSRVGGAPLTYDQVQQQVRALVAAESPQVPQFEGALDRVVFGSQARRAPLGLRVKSVGDQVVLRGALVPGIGPGAELRVYDGALEGAATSDPAQSLATLRVQSPANALETVAAIVKKGPGKGALREGDLAVLARPAEELVRLKVQLRSEGRPGGVPAERAAAICAQVAEDPEARETVRLVVDGRAATLCAAAATSDAAKRAFRVLPPGAAVDLELSLGSDGALELRDSRDLVRRRYVTGAAAEPADVTLNLWAHARQLALLKLSPEGGGAFVENRTIAVRLLPNPEQLPCRQGSFREPSGSEPYHVPICFRYLVEAELSPDSPVPLRVGGLLLSSDGKILPLVDQLDNVLQPGKKKLLGRVISGPPDGARDVVLVIGTQDRNPIRIEELAARGGLPATKGAETRGTLQRALGRYLHATRSAGADDEIDDSAWTRTVVLMEVHANAEFEPPAAGTAAAKGLPAAREYTLASYDIRPFLPRNPGSALRKLLLEADRLVSYSGTDGVPYRQHDWSEASDAANLAKGIDCSRTVHFAFTRSGLPYNRATTRTDPLGRYLPTVEMAKADGPMRDYFDRCDDDPELRTGDVLVYRDDVKGDGHTVIVVDPRRRVAVGSHGWDGNAAPGTSGDTGVEYQLIRYKPDWERWDRKTMVRKACWRYRRFTEEAAILDNRPGSQPFEITCKQVGCGKAALR